jgi:hypothetical protein
MDNRCHTMANPWLSTGSLSQGRTGHRRDRTDSRRRRDRTGLPRDLTDSHLQGLTANNRARTGSSLLNIRPTSNISILTMRNRRTAHTTAWSLLNMGRPTRSMDTTRNRRISSKEGPRASLIPTTAF